MGETTTVERPDNDVFPPATFDETVVETSPEIEATKANIEHTRAEMSETINAIKDHLSPKRLVEEAKEAASNTVSEKVTEVKDAVKEKVSDIAHGAGDIAHNVVASVTGAAHSLGEKVSELTGNAKDKINDLTHGSAKTERVSSYPSTTGYSSQSRSFGAQTNVGEVLMDTVKENPIPTALVGVGLGWLLVDAIIKQQKHSTHPLTSSTYNGYTSETYGDTGYGVARGASYGSYASNPGTTVTTSTYTTGTGTGTNNYTTASNTGDAKSALDQAGSKLSETGEKIGDAIDGAKAKIGDTASDLQSKASDLAHNVQDKAGDATALVSYRIAESIKANPVPAAIAGVSVGWLLLDALMKPHKHNQPYTNGNGYYGDTSYGTENRSLTSQAGSKLSETGEKIGDAIDGAKAKIGDTASDLQSKASDLAHNVQDKAGDATALVTTKASELGYAVQSNARKATDATQDFVTDNPLAAGAIALLVGTAIGLALPSTAQENKLMGSYRDQLADQAGQRAQDLIGKVQDVAGDAIDVAKEQLVDGKASVKTQMTEAIETVKTQLSEAKDKVQSAVETSAKASDLIPA